MIECNIEIAGMSASCATKIQELHDFTTHCLKHGSVDPTWSTGERQSVYN